MNFIGVTKSFDGVIFRHISEVLNEVLHILAKYYFMVNRIVSSLMAFESG